MGDFDAYEYIATIAAAPVSAYLLNVLNKETRTAAAMGVC